MDEPTSVENMAMSRANLNKDPDEVAAMFDGAQERFRGVPAPAFALIHFKVVAALVITRIKVIDGLNACLRGRLAK